MRIAKCSLVAVMLALFVSLACDARAADEPQKIKVLVVTGFDAKAHNWRDTTLQTLAILEEAGRFEVKVCEDIGIFESSSLNSYDVVVLNYGFWNAPDPSDEGKAGLLNYVKGGKGLVAIHFASSSFQEWDEYAELLGRVWKKGVGGHGPRGTFTVNVKKSDHPVAGGLVDFEADDELYAKLSGEAQIEVIASAYSDWSQKVEPIVFVKPYGKGRVVHNVLGHDERARGNKSFQAMLCRGVEWAAAGKVSAD